ncbi:MAG: RpiB/LacA/LacB family sugar-phosphate isomerase, partial [Patescibacteria group bacterium]
AVFYGPAVARRVVDAHGRSSHDPYEIIHLVRAYNDSNMLSLGSSFVSFEDIRSVVKLWLETPFSAEDRHERRIKKLDEI